MSGEPAYAQADAVLRLRPRNIANIFTTEDQTLLNNLKVEHENLVAKWLQNSFKIQENAALDLRATPLSLQIPMAEVNNRPVFKMNNDFWNQPRGPPQSMAQNLSNSNQNSPVPGSTNSIPAHSPSQQSNSSQNHVITQGALALQQAHAAQQAQQQQQQAQQQHNQMQQQQQQAQNSQSNQAQANQQNNPMNPNQNSVQQNQQQAANQGQQPQPQHGQQLGSPNAQSQAHAHAQALAQAQAQAQAAQQQLAHMAQQQQLGSGQNSPDKMTEKFVNDLQVGWVLLILEFLIRTLDDFMAVLKSKTKIC